jgi:ATP-dependent Clp protease protease subunit
MRYWTITAQAESVDIMLYGDIGDSYWSEGVTAKDFAEDLKAAGDTKQINLFIQSGGGSVFEALAIHSQLARHSARKTVYIDGIAASAASIIAMVGDEIVMPENAYMMIHRATGGVIGNAEDMFEMAGTLEKIDGTLSGIYNKRTGREDALELMKTETWMTGAEALEMGFCDRVEGEAKIAASIDLTRYKNAPEIAQEELTEPTNRDESQPVEDKMTEQQQNFNEIRKKLLEEN